MADGQWLYWNSSMIVITYQSWSDWNVENMFVYDEEINDYNSWAVTPLKMLCDWADNQMWNDWTEQDEFVDIDWMIFHKWWSLTQLKMLYDRCDVSKVRWLERGRRVCSQLRNHFLQVVANVPIEILYDGADNQLWSDWNAEQTFLSTKKSFSTTDEQWHDCAVWLWLSRGPKVLFSERAKRIRRERRNKCSQLMTRNNILKNSRLSHLKVIRFDLRKCVCSQRRNQCAQLMISDIIETKTKDETSETWKTRL